jgi:hypothetical protein
MASRKLLTGFDHRKTEPAGGGPAELAGIFAGDLERQP